MWGDKFDIPTFHVRLADLDRFIDLLKEALPLGWNQDDFDQTYYKEKDPNPLFVFVKDTGDPGLLSHITIRRTGQDEWQASDLTVHQGKWSSESQCAQLLGEFESALHKATSKIGSKIEFAEE
jgi:hypothetical protein